MRMSRSDHERTDAARLLAEAEEVRRQPRRERCRKVVDDLELAVVDETVDEVVNGCIDRALEPLHRLRREPARDERALLVVRRIVLGDHVLFLRRDARPVATAAREDVGAPFDVDQRGVLHDRPQLVLLVAPHRTFGTHGAERVVHAVDIGVEVDVEQIRRRHARESAPPALCVESHDAETA